MKSLFLFLVPIIFLTIAGMFLQFKVVSQPEESAKWLSSFGPFLYLAYFLIQAVSVLIPPLSGAVVQWALVALIGPAKGLLIIYIVVTPLYCINFLLAKRFGRPLVQKFVGRDGMAKIDHYAKDAGLGTIIMLKIFMNNFFDYISYGIGLTNITFKQFIIVNFLCGIPATLISYYIFSHSVNFITSLATLGLVGLTFTGIYTLYHHWQHKKITRIPGRNQF